MGPANAGHDVYALRPSQFLELIVVLILLLELVPSFVGVRR
jgi:hypothetical protein